MNLRFWKPKAQSATPPSIQPVRRESIKIRLSDWRADPKLVGQAMNILAMEQFQWMLDVLKHESPANIVLPLGAAPAVRAAHQCRAEGYLQAIANLEAMGKLSESLETLEATFEPEETKQDNERT